MASFKSMKGNSISLWWCIIKTFSSYWCIYQLFLWSKGLYFPSSVAEAWVSPETKVCNIYISDTGFTVGLCGLVVNFSLPWLGASLDAIVHDPLEPSIKLLKIKCQNTHCLSTVKDAGCDFSFLLSYIFDDKVTLKKDNKYFYQAQGQMALAKVP